MTVPTGQSASDSEVAALRDTLELELARTARGKARQMLRVGAHLLRVAQLDPASLGKEDPFRWSPRTARRMIGIAAVRSCLEGANRTPAEAVMTVQRALVGQGRSGSARRGSVAAWLAGLPQGARSVVQSEATTWATHLWCALDWERLGAGLVVGGPDHWWCCSGAPGIVLRGRADVRARTGTGSTLAFLTMLGGRPGPTSRLELGLAALVAVLNRQAGDGGPSGGTPDRVIGWWPDCGRTLVVPVEPMLLHEVADAVVRAVRLSPCAPVADAAAREASPGH